MGGGCMHVITAELGQVPNVCLLFLVVHRIHHLHLLHPTSAGAGNALTGYLINCPFGGRLLVIGNEKYVPFGESLGKEPGS